MPANASGAASAAVTSASSCRTRSSHSIRFARSAARSTTRCASTNGCPSPSAALGCTELLASVGMPDPEFAARRRSGELSGGLRQRALIAAAIALDPPLLIADEPTTALDATVQARILALIAEIRSRGTGVLLISHDLAVVGQLADRILVMRGGVIVESGTTPEVLGSPREPYTRQLIAAVPSDVPRGVALTRPEPPVPTVTVAPVAVPPALEGATHGSPVARARPREQELRRARRALHRRRRGLARGSPRRDPRARRRVGSGKTTVARLALGLTAPDAGDGDARRGAVVAARRTRTAAAASPHRRRSTRTRSAPSIRAGASGASSPTPSASRPRAHPRRLGSHGSPRCSNRSGSRHPSPDGDRSRSPAASVSASRSRARSPPRPRS